MIKKPYKNKTHIFIKAIPFQLHIEAKNTAKLQKKNKYKNSNKYFIIIFKFYFKKRKVDISFKINIKTPQSQNVESQTKKKNNKIHKRNYNS